MGNVVKRIVIEKLYDIYDYDITFDRGEIALITGPNGYGKTTILDIIKNALSINLWYFYNLLFSSIEIYWGDETVLKFNKIPASSRNSEQLLFEDESVISYSDSQEYDVKVTHIDKDGKSLVSTTLNEHRLSSLLDRLSHTTPSRRDYMSRFRSLREDDARLSFTDKELRTSFSELRMFARQTSCMFIHAQRIFVSSPLYRHDDFDPIERYTVTNLADSVRDMYQKEMKQYAEKSQQIDSTFIQRQIQNKQTTYSREEYQKKIEELKLKILNFEKYGLIDKYNLVEDYNEGLGAVLSMHIDDMNDKFSIYNKFYDKLARFDKFVSGKGLSNKFMKLDSVNGITFVSDSGRVIPLHKLSSGEQNLVILYYRLVFETNNETLLLLDEPENSMHVEWLKEMLNDYLDTTKALKCQMLIATHSIPFVDGHWDITYDLYNKSYLD